MTTGVSHQLISPSILCALTTHFEPKKETKICNQVTRIWNERNYTVLMIQPKIVGIYLKHLKNVETTRGLAFAMYSEQPELCDLILKFYNSKPSVIRKPPAATTRQVTLLAPVRPETPTQEFDPDQLLAVMLENRQ